MEQAVTRWREDQSVMIGDDVYIANLNSNNYWSAAYQPVCTKPKDYRVIFQLIRLYTAGRTETLKPGWR